MSIEGIRTAGWPIARLLPVLLVGGGGGRLKGGRYVRYPDQPMANLYLSLLDTFGIPEERFGDSTGRLAGVFGA